MRRLSNQMIFSILAVMMVAACSDPKSEIVPAGNPSDWPKEFTESVRALSEEERKLFAGYVLRRGMSRDFGLELPTIGEAIEEQRLFVAEQKKREAEEKALAEKARRELEQRLAEFRAVSTVALVHKKYVPENYRIGRYSDRIQLGLAVYNKSQKDIRGIKGIAKFSDLFGDEIIQLRLSLDEGVKAGQTRTFDGYGIDVNEFNDSHQKLAVTDFKDLKFEFIPSQIVFSDGSSMSVPKGGEL